jgi:RNA polymerase sigma-70 factor (ECF subfamily)
VTGDQERQAAALMVRAQAGDRTAYADLLVILTTLARRYVRASAGDVPWVDDVVQETLISVHRARHTYDQGRPFAPWFYAIARRRTIDVLRRERRIGAREIGTDLETAPPGLKVDLKVRGSMSDETNIDVEAIHAAVRELPARQREIVSALKLQDESVREISARMGMTETAVKVTAHRGYKALRRLLGKRDEERQD